MITALPRMGAVSLLPDARQILTGGESTQQANAAQEIFEAMISTIVCAQKPVRTLPAADSRGI